MRRVAPLMVVMLWTYLVSVGPECRPGAAWSDDRSESERNHEADQQENAARLATMRRRAMSLTANIATADGLVETQLIETPLLRYSNPASQTITPDATVWAWGRVGRPVVLSSIEENGCEVVSLADQTVSLSGKSGLKWLSVGSEIKWNAVPDAPRPADTAVVRARQMKEIVQRFTATGHYGEGLGNLELRLLIRQLYRYANPEQGLMDGAVYAFAAGTNPEVILLVECRQSNEQRWEWFYGFARLSAGDLEARLGESVVWTCPAISRWSDRAPYAIIRFGEEDMASEDERTTAEKK
jgi:hypothetical protein